MKYELAEELRDAGYPQEVHYGEWIFAPDKTKYFIGNSDDMDKTTGGYSPSLRRESTTARGGFVKIPSLSELIEACGERFWMVEARNLKEGNWHASGYGKQKIEGGYGSTPEEAIARLWLALNKK